MKNQEKEWKAYPVVVFVLRDGEVYEQGAFELQVGISEYLV